MNSVEFFYTYFGRHLLALGDGESHTAHAGRVLSTTYPKLGQKTDAEGNTRDKAPSRLAAGVAAVVRPSGTVLNSAFDVGLPVVEQPAGELIARTLLTWDQREPLMILTFEKVLFPVTNLFVTYDPRRVRICNAKAVTDVNLRDVLTAEKKDGLNDWEARLFQWFKKLRAESSAAKQEDLHDAA